LSTNLRGTHLFDDIVRRSRVLSTTSRSTLRRGPNVSTSGAGSPPSGSKDTARKYLEAAEHLFVWHFYFPAMTPDEPREALKSPKKLYSVI
jgi:predicted AAA+ superfamily ATPase